MSENQRLYDLVFLVVPEKDEQATLAVVDEFRKLLVEQGATIKKDESMGRRRLAYSLKRRTEATYHNFLFNAESKAVAEIQRKMKLSEDVLRFLTVRVDEEMKHGQKVARGVKPRRPVGAVGQAGAVGPATAPVASAPAPVPAPAAAPEGAAPSEPASPAGSLPEGATE